jgi:HEAT repeat protein
MYLIDKFIDKATHDPAQQVVSAALAGLGRYIYEGDVADFEHADEWRELIGENEEEISQADFERTRDFLLGVARDAQASLDSRCSSLEALSFLADNDVTELIDQAYQSGDLSMKTSAIFAMGRQGTVRGADTLLREIDSPVAELRYEAVRAAGESFLEQATPKLLKIADRARDQDLRVAAILALGRTGGEAALAFLEQMTRSSHEVLSEAAEAAMEDWYTYHGETDELDEDDDEL